MDALKLVSRAAEERAGDIPGGVGLAKLMLSRARNFVLDRDEEELRRYLAMAQAVAGSILTGEGFDDLMKLENGGDGGSSPAES